MPWSIFKRRREAAPATDDACAACDARDLEAIGARAYRCRVCGYEGGSGLGALHEACRRATLAGMSPARRRDVALGDLRFARALLLDADGTLSGLAESGAAAAPRLAAVHGELERARRLIVDALLALGWSDPIALACLQPAAPSDVDAAWGVALEMRRGVDRLLAVVG